MPNFGREYGEFVSVHLSSQNWSAMSSTARKRENINILVWCHITILTALYFHLTLGLDANTQVIFNLQSNTFSWLKIQIKIKNQIRWHWIHVQMFRWNPHLWFHLKYWNSDSDYNTKSYFSLVWAICCLKDQIKKAYWFLNLTGSPWIESPLGPCGPGGPWGPGTPISPRGPSGP